MPKDTQTTVGPGGGEKKTPNGNNVWHDPTARTSAPGG